MSPENQVITEKNIVRQTNLGIGGSGEIFFEPAAWKAGFDSLAAVGLFAMKVALDGTSLVASTCLGAGTVEGEQPAASAPAVTKAVGGSV